MARETHLFFKLMNPLMAASCCSCGSLGLLWAGFSPGEAPGLSLCGPAQTTLYEVIQAAQSYTCSSINLALPLNMPSVDPASCLEPRLLPDSLWRESPVLWSTDAPLHWTRRELCPLCGPHCGSVMSTFDSCEQPKSCPCVIRRACVSPIRG